MGYIPPHSALDPAFWTTQNIFVASATILVTLILLIIRYPQDLIGTSRRSKNVIALPNALPLLGDTLLALKISFKQKKLLDEILYHQLRIGKGGKPVSISFPSLGNRQYILNMPQYVHYCQKTEFETFAKGDNFHRRLSDLLGEHGIFVVDGEPWKRQRKMASHIFSVGNFRTCVQQTIDSDLLKMEKLLTNVAKEKVSINLPDLFFRFTLSSFSQLAFSADVECLPETVEGLNIRNSFADAFDFAQLVADERFVAIFPLWLEHFTPTGFKMRKALKTLQTYCYRTIDLRLSARARGENQGAVDSKNGKDLLELFMDMGLSRKELLPIVLNFLIAGRDTTAQSLSWFFLEMATHPEIIEKIREEIQDSFGDRLNESHLTYDDMKQLPYLHAAFYEAIRLHPAVPKNIKQATQDTIIRPYATNDIDAKRDLPGGGTTERLPDITIKKGESVIWSDYVMARMPEIWGKDCEEYKPERFLETRDGKTSVRQFPQAIFHAFNGGPRVCLGQTLATYEGMAVIIAILTNFDIIYDYEKLKSDPPTFAESLTHPIQNPYSVRIQRRNHH